MSTDPQEIKPAHLLKADAWQFEYRQKSNPRTSHLDLLSYGVYRIASGAVSDELFHRGEETLLFSLTGTSLVEVDGRSFELSHYDTLYIPLATPYRITNRSREEGRLAVCRAVAQNQHSVFYSSWEQVRRNEDRIRHLDGKDVFLMFDVSESADRLLAGYTIYQPDTRAWPPHNHTD
ncbi:MAG: cupin domain-containing protein, partial [Pirellulaceae bacterium]